MRMSNIQKVKFYVIVNHLKKGNIDHKNEIIYDIIKLIIQNAVL